MALLADSPSATAGLFPAADLFDIHPADLRVCTSALEASCGFDLLTPPASPPSSGGCSPIPFTDRLLLEEPDAELTHLLHVSEASLTDVSTRFIDPDHAAKTGSFLRPKDLNAHFRAIDELAGLFGRSMTPPMEDDVVSSIPSSGLSSPCSDADFDPIFAAAALPRPADFLTLNNPAIPAASYSLLDAAVSIAAPAEPFPTDDLDFLDLDLDPIPTADFSDSPIVSRKRARTLHGSDSADAPANKARRRVRPAVAVVSTTSTTAAAAPARQVKPLHTTVSVAAAAATICPSSGTHAAQKRDQHNISERMRRQGLKSSFEDLRLTIPSLEAVPNAHTGQILEAAVDLIRSLQLQEQELIRAKSELRAQIATNRVLLA